MDTKYYIVMEKIINLVNLTETVPTPVAVFYTSHEADEFILNRKNPSGFKLFDEELGIYLSDEFNTTPNGSAAEYTTVVHTYTVDGEGHYFPHACEMWVSSCTMKEKPSTDYTNLVKQLRYCANSDPICKATDVCEFYDISEEESHDYRCTERMMLAAADAIEELRKAGAKMHEWIFLNSGDEMEAYKECGLTEEQNAMFGYFGRIEIHN